MPRPLRVLSIEDSPDDTELLVIALQKGGYTVTCERVETPAEMRAALNQRWDVILADFNLPRFSAVAALNLVRDCGLDLPFIVVSGTIGEDVAVEAMRTGVNDYLVKTNLSRLVPAVEREVQQAAIRKDRWKAAAQFAALVHSSDDAIISEDLDGFVTSWNPAAERLFGWSAREAIGRPVSFLAPSERAAEAARMREKVARRERVTSLETVRVHKDGRLLDVSVTLSPVWNGDGRSVGASRIYRDITQRKQIEAILARDAMILANVRDAVILADPDGRVVYWNEGATRLYGWRSEEMIGRSIVERVPESARRPITDRLEKLQRGGEIAGEWEDYRRDGSRVWVEGRISPVREADGRLAGFLGLTHDITDRKRAEAAMRESEEKFHSVVENIQDVIARFDRGCRYVYVNKSTLKYLPRRPEDFLGKTLGELGFPEEKAAYWERTIREVFETGQAKELELVLDEKDGAVGGPLYFDWRLFPEWDENGRVRYVVTASLDITERKRQETQLAETVALLDTLLTNSPVGDRVRGP